MKKLSPKTWAGVAIATTLTAGITLTALLPTAAAYTDLGNVSLGPTVDTDRYDGVGLFGADSIVLDPATATLPIEHALVPGFSYDASVSVFNNSSTRTSEITVRLLGGAVSASRIDVSGQHLVSLSIDGQQVLDRVPLADAHATITLPPRAGALLQPGDTWSGSTNERARLDFTLEYPLNATTEDLHDGAVCWQVALTATPRPS
ncbi:hypothetical protein [Leifsonia poae]|uniref:Uncharacterized protein n=1 Tax=Leifsonia poae TaxID=110933 RepID=A0A9W6H7Q7_9MICO|nr:hypothetical protein [Leifsonia poae]GLJ74907.1 hypothetical protein GCM10017584_04800 [Leifsonia poae]